jgi:hypothetical protein
MMADLQKLWVAYFHEKGQKRPFASNKVVAPNFTAAMDKAGEWGTDKYGRRLEFVKIEKSKTGEVIV